jgi:predicted AAA+ superfamily ATPase
LDEVQKVPGWSEAVKRLWDEDSARRVPLRVMVLGSAPLLVARGLTESLTGRFELVRVTHWSLAEMRDAFGWGLKRFLFFGGYPGAAALADDEERWRRYILDSLVETTIARDVLLLTRVDKPALLRQLFQLACDYSGQILSFTKMLGSLQDAGNTTTLAHYLELLSGAGMVVGLQKFAGSATRRRASSPKLIVLNTALMNAVSGRSYREATGDHKYWGRVVESAVGAHLVNAGVAEVSYWRERDLEVDFVLGDARKLAAIEVTTAGHKPSLAGLAAFAERFHPKRQLLVGGQGIPLDEFLLRPAMDWMR